MDRAAAAVVVLLMIGSFAFRPDLFPFTTFPMFSDNTQSMSWLEVEGPEGPLLAGRFELDSDYVVNRTPRYGHRVVGPNPLGARAEPAEVERRVRKALEQEGLPWVEVRERTFYVAPDGSIQQDLVLLGRFEARP